MIECPKCKYPNPVGGTGRCRGCSYDLSQPIISVKPRSEPKIKAKSKKKAKNGKNG